jgi:hypothetical protein
MKPWTAKQQRVADPISQGLAGKEVAAELGDWLSNSRGLIRRQSLKRWAYERSRDGSQDARDQAIVRDVFGVIQMVFRIAGWYDGRSTRRTVARFS